MHVNLGIIGGGRAAWAFGSTWRRLGWPIAGVTLREDLGRTPCAPTGTRADTYTGTGADTRTGTGVDRGVDMRADPGRGARRAPSPIASLLGTRSMTLDELAKESELILIAVSDAAIADFAQRIPSTNAVIFHCSGSMTSVRGGFSLHPLRALPPLGAESDLRDTLLVFEGAHKEIAARIATAAGARLAEIAPEEKPLYHAGAVFGANYVAALLDIAESLMADAGVENVRGDLVALTRSAVDNWARTTGPGRFTGPAARGDEAVIEQHLRALASRPEIAEIYRLLADWIVAARK